MTTLSARRGIVRQASRAGLDLLRRHPLPTFFVLAFALSWSAAIPLAFVPDFPFHIFPFGPFIAALIVGGLTDGRPGLRAILSQMVHWRVAPRWYAVALLLPLALSLVALGVTVTLGAPPPSAAQLGAWPAMLPMFAMLLLVPGFGGAWEEPGWRGFALPRLQAGRSALAPSLLLGAVVAVWHLPLFLVGEFRAPDFVSTLVAAILLTWLYNGTGGSVLLTAAFHAANNAAGRYIGGIVADDFAEPFAWLRAGVWAAAALLVVLLAGSARLGRPQPRGRAWAAATAGVIGPLLAGLVVLGSLHITQQPGHAAGALQSDPGEPNLGAINAYVESEMRAAHVPGAALAIVHGDRIVHVKGFGTADASGRPVTARTPFPIVSVTKSFTAVGIMQLVEQGRVDLDAPVQRYLPWFLVADPDASSQITVRHLLTHTTGIPRAAGEAILAHPDTDDGALERNVRTLAQVALEHPVGANYEYNNIDYAALGLVIQAVTGQNWEAYIQQHVLAALQMRDSFTSPLDGRAHGMVSGHQFWFGVPIAAEMPYFRGTAPSTYVISSAEDLAHYLIAQLDGGRYGEGTVLSAGGMDMVHQPAVRMGSRDRFYGFGWEIGDTNGIPTVSTYGDGPDVHSDLILVPEDGWGIALLANANSAADAYFGAARIKSIAAGVTSLLIGRQPPAARPATTLLQRRARAATGEWDGIWCYPRCSI